MTAALGALFALALQPLWDLQFRWAVVSVVGLMLVSLSMILVRHFSGFLMLALFFTMPLASVNKWLFLDLVSEDRRGTVVYAGTIGLSIVDFLIFGLYASWFYRIFVSREARLPRLERLDWLVGLLVVAYIVSMWGVPEPALAVFALEFLVKHLLVYFYVSRNLRRWQLRWLILAFLAAIVLQAGIGLVQNQTDMLRGLGRDKGASDVEAQTQYRVPGIEDFQRAEGTTLDSHSLGLYLAMLLPVPFVFMLGRQLGWRARLGCAATFFIGLVGLLLTFSRSAWLSCALSLGIGALVLLLVLKETHILRSILVLVVPLLLILPWGLAYVYERFAHAPTEVLTARFEQYRVALQIWRHHPLFGFGVGNYMEALPIYSFDMALELPVHNVFLWVAAETGLLGLIAFYGIILAAARRLWKLVRRASGRIRLLALALLLGLIAYLLDGLTDPLFREPAVYLMFWMTVALAVALPRINAGRPTVASAGASG